MRRSQVSGVRAVSGLALAIAVIAGCSNVTGTSDSSASTRPSTTTTIRTTTSLDPTTTTTMRTTTSLDPTTTTVTAVATTAVEPLAGITVSIDPGHNGRNAEHVEEIGELVDIGNGTKPCNTTGTASYDGYPESAFTWEVAALVRTLLADLGAQVIMTRMDNEGWGPCITERAAIGNRGDVAVSIHADGAGADDRGFHVIHPAPIDGLTDDIADESRRLAEILVSEMANATEIPPSNYLGDAGLDERSDLGGLNLSDVPVVFLEAGNMRNVEDMAVLGDPTGRAAIAQAIARAIVRFVHS